MIRYRYTRGGLRAHRSNGYWHYARLNLRTGEYEETGTTRRFQP